eukprot:160780-Chlamydomonas_euryale.AAC.1
MRAHAYTTSLPPPTLAAHSTSARRGSYDEREAYLYMCRAALEFLKESGMQPDVLQLHDWHAAATALLYWECYHNEGLSKPKVRLGWGGGKGALGWRECAAALGLPPQRGAVRAQGAIGAEKGGKGLSELKARLGRRRGLAAGALPGKMGGRKYLSVAKHCRPPHTIHPGLTARDRRHLPYLRA